MRLQAPVISGMATANPKHFVIAAPPPPDVYGTAYPPDEDPEDTALKHLTENGMSPTLVLLHCVQCDTLFTVIIYKHEVDEVLEEEVAVFPSKHGGLRTAHTPEAVAYYLDQADRCESVSARSAAVGMYRVALEQMLVLAGYNEPMLGKKIAALEEDLNTPNSKAPDWVRGLNPLYLTTIKDLGNGTLHTNGGDISLQANATPELLTQIRTTFRKLLKRAYDDPASEAKHLEDMVAAATAMSPPKTKKVP